MSGLIKAGHAANGMTISPFTGIRDSKHQSPATALPPPADPQAEQIERLHDLLADRDREIARLQHAVSDARAQGRQEGRMAAQLEIEDDRERTLALLTEGLASASAAMENLRDHFEALSVLVARSAIARMFGEQSTRHAVVADLIAHQLRQIDQSLLLAIEVSRLDFPDTREVSDVLDARRRAGVTVDVRDDLDAGDCRLKLRLGTIEIGANQQWGTIRQLLDDMLPMTLDWPA